jgi:predicted nucleic acid-binding protein
MTSVARFVIDAEVALRLVRERQRLPADRALVAPALLKSEVLQRLHSAVRAGEIDRRDAVELLERFAALKVRYLSDRVSRRVALEIATELDDDRTGLAEYLAVTRLQADAFVTLDDDRARSAAGVVAVASYEALTS